MFAFSKGFRSVHLPVGVMNIGFGNYVVKERVIAIISADSAPMRRAIQEARRVGQLVDATQGRRTRSAIYTDASHIIISGLNQETLAKRLGDARFAGEPVDGDL
jgi:extracellular matrix regulatory protein A